jgi:hypothetical protein
MGRVFYHFSDDSRNFIGYIAINDQRAVIEIIHIKRKTPGLV